jgi:hypothetical protein
MAIALNSSPKIAIASSKITITMTYAKEPNVGAIHELPLRKTEVSR